MGDCLPFKPLVSANVGLQYAEHTWMEPVGPTVKVVLSAMNVRSKNMSSSLVAAPRGRWLLPSFEFPPDIDRYSRFLLYVMMLLCTFPLCRGM